MLLQDGNLVGPFEQKHGHGGFVQIDAILTLFEIGLIAPVWVVMSAFIDVSVVHEFVGHTRTKILPGPDLNIQVVIDSCFIGHAPNLVLVVTKSCAGFGNFTNLKF